MLHRLEKSLDLKETKTHAEERRYTFLRKIEQPGYVNRLVPGLLVGLSFSLCGFFSFEKGGHGLFEIRQGSLAIRSRPKGQGVGLQDPLVPVIWQDKRRAFRNREQLS